MWLVAALLLFLLEMGFLKPEWARFVSTESQIACEMGILLLCELAAS